MTDYNYFQNLSLTESQAVVEKLFNEIIDEDEIEETLLYLSIFTNGECLKEFYPTLIEKKIFYYPEIYRHADSSIANRLIEVLEQNNDNNNHILICLAWIGTQNVIDFFIKSSKSKPKWAKELYVLPKQYADQAGWIIDENETKRELISQEVKVLKNKSSTENETSENETFSEHEKECSFCKSKLTTVFSTQIDGKLIEFTSCLLCSCYEPFYMRIDTYGKSSLYENNKKWEYFDDSMKMDVITPNTLVITNEKRKPEHTISQFIMISKSQIGGYPSWVQDSEYLDCPECKRTMDFIGQIDFEDVEEYGEGIYYFQHCKKCNITGTNYQQT